MYTLKGIFPEPKKEQKKNFIKENMKQLKLIQNKSPRDQKYTAKNVHKPTYTATNILSKVKSSPSNKSGKVTLNVNKISSSNPRKKHTDVRIRKGDMAEFLKRKEARQFTQEVEEDDDCDEKSSGSSGRRDIGCQTIDINLSQRLESTRLTMLYPKDNDKIKASGDSGRQRSTSPLIRTPNLTGDEILEDKNRRRVTAILEKKDKDPYLPSGYQKGVLPKYLREKKEKSNEIEGVNPDEESGLCPAGHVTLPDIERKETLRMLRNSFAELVSELNKLPVKTDTLRMRNRKVELEKQLAKLEEGIKVFSRPKVFVKIGE